MSARPPAPLRALPPALALHVAAAGLVVWLAAGDAGGPLARWGPAALVATWVLGVAAVALPRPRASRAVRVAVGALAGFLAWSALSVTWAAAPGEAAAGTLRLVAPAAVFAAFALWPVPGRWALVAPAALAAGVALVAGAVVAGLLGSPGADAFVGGRLAAPAGYPNAAAMLFELGLWPAVLLAAARAAPAALRAAGAGAAVVLVQLVLLTESRGAVLALPLTALAVLTLLPGRVRVATALALVAAGAAVAGVAAGDVGAALAAAGGDPAAPAVDEAIERALVRALLCGLVVAVAVAAWARGDRRAPAGSRAARLGHRAGAAIAAGAVALTVLAGVLAAGGPGALPDRAQDAWRSFQGGYAEQQEGPRLTSGLGSDRYDFFRVALEQFRAEPLRGAGTDQFRAVYLREGRGLETPRHPHSLELRLLSQNGVVGALLFAAFAGGAAVAGLRAARGRGASHAAAAAAAGLAGFAAWLVHGSADWFLELPGLAGVAFALLGVAAGARSDEPEAGRPLVRSPPAVALAVAAVVLLSAAVAGPWLADRDVARAGQALAQRPGEALARLDRAARLDPLGAGALRAEGTARMRLGDLRGADAAFAQALTRDPEDLYATLARGALASAQGERRRARRLLVRAVALAPRFDIARQALRVVRQGRRIDLTALQRELLERGDI